jgi:hypothetical protein
VSENRIRKVDSTKTNPTQARAPYGPQSSGIEYDAGRNGLALNPDGTVRLHPDTWTETAVLSGTTPATGTNFGAFYVAPYGVEVVSVKMRFGTAGTSATVDVKKAPSGTALSGGTSVLSGTMSGAGAADTNVAGSLSATAANKKLAAGDVLGLVAGGTLTNFANLVVSVELRRRPDVA